MASAFAHLVVPAVIKAGFGSPRINGRLILLAAVVCVLPDLDVLAFHFGIPYHSPWGHRGFTHSISFALLLALLLSAGARLLASTPLAVFSVCFVACVSHPLLDMLTNGGLGVALLWPFSDARLFFPYRPIQVSPIGISTFFSKEGLQVIRSELLWVGLPGVALAGMGMAFRRINTRRIEEF